MLTKMQDVNDDVNLTKAIMQGHSKSWLERWLV